MAVKNKIDVANSIVKRLSGIFDGIWNELLEGKHVYSLPKHIYLRNCETVILFMIPELRFAEQKFIRETDHSEDYPDGCLARANRSGELWEAWDRKFKKVLPSWMVYSYADIMDLEQHIARLGSEFVDSSVVT